MQETFKDLYEGTESVRSVNLLELGARQTPLVNKTDFYNPPVANTSVPINPCTDPKAGAPSDETKTKGRGKCSLSKSPNCPKIQERFLLIQSGIKDEAENLLQEINFMEESCKTVEATLDTQIEDDKNRQGEAEVDLAEATKMEAYMLNRGSLICSNMRLIYVDLINYVIYVVYNIYVSYVIYVIYACGF
jgi:hypothetical protein